MTQHTSPQSTVRRSVVHPVDQVHDGGCDPQTRVTRSLLGYGMVVGPVYIAVVLAQALNREGFDLSRHPASLLAAGPWGWIQVADFVVSGLMVITFAVGMRRAGAGRRACGLLASYGVSLIAAGLFRADPAAGYPVGTAAAGTAVSWHGLLHLVAGGIGFSCLAIACFALARAFSSERRRGWALWSHVTGAAFLAGFVVLAASGGSRFGTVGFSVALVGTWVWIAAVAADRYRRLAR